MKYLILFILLLLPGCATLQDQVRDNLSDGVGVATTAAITAVTGNPIVGATVGGGASVVVNTVTQPEEQPRVEIQEITNVHQAKAVEVQAIADAAESLGRTGIYTIGGVILAFPFVSWLIGRLTPRRSEIRLQERERMSKERNIL